MTTTDCNCEACPLGAYWRKLGQFEPCLNEDNGGTLAIIGDAPGKQDVEAGRPWTDRFGAQALDAIKAHGHTRKSFTWANVVQCRWPKDRAKEFLAVLKKRNRYRKRKKEAPHPSPMACCRPALNKVLATHTMLIPMGEMATKAILPGNPNHSEVRGGPTEVGGAKVLPTWHPRDLLFQPKYNEAFLSDIAKAFRYFRNNLNWVDPEIHWNPTPAKLALLINLWKLEGRVVTVDLETNGLESLLADVRCIGLGTKDTVVMIHLLSRDGETKFYGDDIGPWCGSKADELAIRTTVSAFLADPLITKMGHNFGYFDRIVCEQNFGVTPAPVIDTILLHKLAASEYPHNLGYIGSIHTDAPAWKSEHSATDAKTDYELGAYCVTDIVVPSMVARPLKQLARERKQLRLYRHDAKLQELCVGMHRLGIRVDEGQRRAHEKEQTEKAAYWRSRIPAGLNPNSHEQVRELLFRKWALPAYEMTDSGEASTNNSSLIFLYTNPLVDEDQKQIIEAIRKYKRAGKLLNTYLSRFAPESPLVIDGYVHADWNVTGTVTGRFSATLLQTVPYILRNIFVPPPDCLFVEADYDQLELRFAAALAGLNYYLEMFKAGKVDPHSATSELMFGRGIWALKGAPKNRLEKGKKKSPFVRARDTAKTIQFLSLYGGGAPMVRERMVATEDGDGGLPYSGYSLREVRSLHRRWKRQLPELEQWWNDSLKFWRHHGYIEEPIMGRRCYFHEEDFNAIPNFQVQSGGFAIVAQGMTKAVQKIPFNFDKRTGLVNQLHDAVLFAVPQKRAEQAKQDVVESLTQTHMGMRFTVDAGIADCWGGK